MRTILISLIVVAAASGCIQNMADLKDRVAGGDEALEPAGVVEPAATKTPSTNNTTVLRPPVARITVFAQSGALAFKSTFQADNSTDLVIVEDNSTVRLVASDSETLEPGAEIVTFEWTLNDKPVQTGRSTTAEIGEPGLYTLRLVVTDSNGQTDDQTVLLGVAPKPFDVTTELVTGLVLGADGVGESGEATFTLKLADAGVPATVSGISFTARPGPACDAILDVMGPDEMNLGSKDETGAGGVEVVRAGAVPEGDYTITVGPFACAAPDGVPVTVVVTFLPTVPGFSSEDGHGAHAGH